MAGDADVGMCSTARDAEIQQSTRYTSTELLTILTEAFVAASVTPQMHMWVLLLLTNVPSAAATTQTCQAALCCLCVFTVVCCVCCG